MAIKGNAYTKTTWAFGERPVASAKLNSWDDRIESALELVHYLVNLAWGGGDGILRGATSGDLGAAAKAPPALHVEVGAGYAFISKYPYRLTSAMDTPAVTPPTTHPRIDLVQARLTTWDISVKTGTESASPTAPSPDADCLALAQLYLRPGMTCIKDSDDSTNGYIIDVRAYL